MMNNLLDVSNLTKTYKDFELSNVSFTLPKGYIMGLIGPNGSGKTTTIKLIMNMILKNSGSIQIFGKDHMESEIKNQIGYVSDENIFVDDWTIRDVEKVMQMYYEGFSQQSFQNYVSKFNMPSDKKIKKFSKGMKTKLMLAAVLARDTKLLLLDEPTSGLDPVIRSELLDILQEYICDGEKSVLFSTHITTDLEKVADYITFLYQGKLVFSDSKDNVLDNYQIVKGLEQNNIEKINFIGYRSGCYGIDGLITADNAAKLPSGIVTDCATLDDIIIYHTLGERK